MNKTTAEIIVANPSDYPNQMVQNATKYLEMLAMMMHK